MYTQYKCVSCWGQMYARTRAACVKTKSDIDKTGWDVLKAQSFPEGMGACVCMNRTVCIASKYRLAGWMLMLESPWHLSASCVKCDFNMRVSSQHGQQQKKRSSVRKALLNTQHHVFYSSSRDTLNVTPCLINISYNRSESPDSLLSFPLGSRSSATVGQFVRRFLGVRRRAKVWIE